jgi:HTH-type transcriptional regulator/antitoxin HipB
MSTALRTPAEIGALIRERRRAWNLNQADLARRLQVSRLWIGEIERGKPGANLGLVLRTLDTLGIKLTATMAEDAPATAYPPVDAPDLDAIIDKARRR